MDDENTHDVFEGLLEDGLLPFCDNSFPFGQDIATSSSQSMGPTKEFVFTSPSGAKFGSQSFFQKPKRRRNSDTSVQGRPLKLPKQVFSRGSPPKVFHFTVPKTGAPHTPPPEHQEHQSNRQLPSRSDKGRAKEGKTFMDNAGE